MTKTLFPLLFIIVTMCQLLISGEPCLAKADIFGREIHDKKDALKKITREIHDKQKKLSNLETEEQEIMAAIQGLNQKISHHWTLLQEKKETRARIEGRIKEVSRSMEKLKESLEKQQPFVEMRLRALWEFGPLGILNVLFSSHSIGELYSRQQYLLSIIQKDRIIMKKFMEDMKRLKKKREDLNREKALLLKLEKEVEAEALRLEEAMETKKIFLEDLKAQKQSYEILLSSLKSTEENINRIIRQLKRKAREKERTQSLPPALHKSVTSGHIGKKMSDLDANRGELTPPIIDAYKIITPEKDPRVPGHGIILECRIGAPVRAIFDGTVKFAGFVKGFGTVVILDHGHGYMSLTGYLSRAFVVPGRVLFEGDTIGVAGPAGLVDAGAYLEIRKDGHPVDPLAFIDTRGMIVE